MPKIKTSKLSLLLKMSTFLLIGYGAWIFYGIVTKPKPKHTYQDQDIEKILNDCYLNAKITKYYPEVSMKNCECITNEVVNKYTPEEFLEIDKLPPDKMYIKLKDIITKCAHMSGRDTIHIR